MSLQELVGCIDDENRSALIQQLSGQAAKDKALESEGAFADFLGYLLRGFSMQDWQTWRRQDLYACCKQLWQLLQSASGDSPSLSVFNPSEQSHGWSCQHTVIMLCQQDMPFLVDSLRLALNSLEIPVLLIKSTPLLVTRASDGEITKVQKSLPHQTKEGVEQSLIYIEIGLHTDQKEHRAIAQALENALRDVALTVHDYGDIIEKLREVATNVQLRGESVNEVVALTEWLQSSHFTFLGYREYALEENPNANQKNHRLLREDVSCRRGLFNKLEPEPIDFEEHTWPPGVVQFHQSETAVCFSKSSTRSTVHRNAYPDYIVFKRYNSEGKVIGEARFLGLFTYVVYTESPRNIPILRDRIAAMIARANVNMNSHEGKNILQAIESFPRDELFQSDIDSLYKNILATAEISERHIVRVIIRRDTFGRFLNCLVYVPKDLYNTKIKKNIRSMLSDKFGSNECDTLTHFSESNLARAQFIFNVKDNAKIKIDIKELEEEIYALVRGWEDRLLGVLQESYGYIEGVKIHRQCLGVFPLSYQEKFSIHDAVKDIGMLLSLNEQERLNSKGGISKKQDICLDLYQPTCFDQHKVAFKLLHSDPPLALSDVVPILEKMGLRVLSGHPYTLSLGGNKRLWLHDFELGLDERVDFDLLAVKPLFEAAFLAIWNKQCESDAFNALVLSAQLHWREANMLRAYAAYMKQTRFPASMAFIAEALSRYPKIARGLVALFDARFNPATTFTKKNNHSSCCNEDRGKQIACIVKAVLDDVECVDKLNEDRVLRRYLDMLMGTLRTNYYQKVDGEYKPYLAIKLSPRNIADIPEPRPLFEIFVYAPDMEGVHLRAGKVSRGGLRWSDRLEDYRTEVLGLVKAQQVKNAVIVPNGAKGGFILKSIGVHSSSKDIAAEGVRCYQQFIRGLLDLTDNIVDGQIVSPPELLRWDEDDPYLVVAADKGTASFSDIANALSNEYGHWMGDAFASGGSQGYDHKSMGITARGAWVSVQRHFRERGLDVQRQDFSVIGIGDMSGDVFGNGMLLSKHIRLLAAFNHLHIFVDPDPDPSSGFSERERLFKQDRSTWSDYQSSLISKGGGVFSRSLKSITITPEMKKCFSIEASTLTPNELIQSLLLAPVDLLWNGGIGTYIKSSFEKDVDVGDKANDVVRVDANKLRCRVFAEGGNLGATQHGRVEMALNGVACNTDFIDNAAGVDCSDHEVNIKILLDQLIADDTLNMDQRNQLLEDMTDDVAKLVLENNYHQTRSISLAESEVYHRHNEYVRFIGFLEGQGRLNRNLEFLPSDEHLSERYGQNASLSRPELAVLISYAKVMLQEGFIQANLADNHYLEKEIMTAFPKRLRDEYGDQLFCHPLRREIVGTQIANDFIDTLGITAAHRLIEATGAPLTDIAKAYIVSRDVFNFSEMSTYLKSLDNCIDPNLQLRLLSEQVRRVRRGTRWFLRNRRTGIDPEKEVAVFREGLLRVRRIAEERVTQNGYPDENSEKEAQDRALMLAKENIDPRWFTRLTTIDRLFSGLGLVEACLICEKEFAADDVKVVETYYSLINHFGLSAFSSLLSAATVDSYWQAVARESYIDDLEAQVRKLTISVIRLANHEGINDTQLTIEALNKRHATLVDRWMRVKKDAQSTQSKDYAVFAVALRELIDLTQAVCLTESL